MNAWSHAVAAFAALATLAAMVWFALAHKDMNWALLGAGAHGGSLTAALTTSAVYHAMPRGRWKRWLQKADHVAIFALIAGTVTPIALLVLDGWIAATVLGTQWGLAIVGAIVKIVWQPHRFPMLSLGLYLGMGWSNVIALPTLWTDLPWPALAGLAGGGLFYTGGVYFFVRDDMRWNHFLWHLFVIAGAACHAWVTLAYVLW